MIHLVLATLVVSATLPFAAALAQTSAEPEVVAPAASVETAQAGPPGAGPITAPLPPAGTPPTLAPVGSPFTTPAAPLPKRRAAVLTQPHAAAALTIVNKRKTPVPAVIVTEEAKTVRHAGPLAPNAKASLKLPKMKGCLVTVAAASQGDKVSKLGDVDVCKEAGPPHGLTASNKGRFASKAVTLVSIGSFPTQGYRTWLFAAWARMATK
jgi:hypothetical protein